MGCLNSCLKPKKKQNQKVHPDEFDIENQKNLTKQEKAQAHKQQGNIFFKKKQYVSAIQEYTKAMEYEQNSVFYSNRALCLKSLQNYLQAIPDCEKAIQLDGKNYKAYNCMGICYINLSNNQDLTYKEIMDFIDKGIFKITQAKQVYKEVGNDIKIVQYLDRNLGRSKYKKWQKQQEKQKQQQRDCLQLVESLLENEENKEELYKEIKNDYIIPQENMEDYNTIPQHFSCPLTFTMFEDPLLVDSGFTYEKNTIQEYFKKSGNKDPQSRHPINIKNQIPNQSLLAAVLNFKEKHPWYYAVDNFDDDEIQ